MLRALALPPHEGISRRQYLPVMIRVPRLSRPVVRGVNWAAPARAIMQDPHERGRHESITHRRRTCPGPCAARASVGDGIPGRTWSPRFSVGQRAPGRVRSQATAQTHQDPLTLGVLRALALPPHEG